MSRLRQSQSQFFTACHLITTETDSETEWAKIKLKSILNSKLSLSLIYIPTPPLMNRSTVQRRSANSVHTPSLFPNNFKHQHFLCSNLSILGVASTPPPHINVWRRRVIIIMRTDDRQRMQARRPPTCEASYAATQPELPQLALRE